MSSNTKSRILIVDDHPLIREGLASQLGLRHDMEVCGEAESVDEALAQVKATSPDLVIVDIALVGSHGLDLIREIAAHFPSIKMLVMSAYDESLYAERCLRAGAHGYINKREVQENIMDALRTVLDGRRYLSDEMTQRLVIQAITGSDPTKLSPIETLSDRELEVFRLIGEGVSTSGIADRMHLSPHTIDTHREKIKTKLNLKNAAQLQREAIQWILENA